MKSELIGFRVMSGARIPLGSDNFSEFLPPRCLSRFASGGLGPHPMRLEGISKLFSQGCLSGDAGYKFEFDSIVLIAGTSIL